MPVMHIGNFPAGKAEIRAIQVKNNEVNLDSQTVELMKKCQLLFQQAPNNNYHTSCSERPH